MSQKDYVKRGRVAKKKEPEKQSGSIIKVSIAVVVILGFILFLWRIKDNAPPQSEEQPLPEIVEHSVEEDDDLPELPQEEWEFIKSLPEYTVEIEQKEQDQSTVRYLMQCGSFRKEQQAQALKAKIAFQGLEAQVRSSKGSSGLWYRVILGPYDSKRLAEKDRHGLQRAKINGCKIWNWNL